MDLFSQLIKEGWPQDQALLIIAFTECLENEVHRPNQSLDTGAEKEGNKPRLSTGANNIQRADVRGAHG